MTFTESLLSGETLDFAQEIAPIFVALLLLWLILLTIVCSLKKPKGNTHEEHSNHFEPIAWASERFYTTQRTFSHIVYKVLSGRKYEAYRHRTITDLGAIGEGIDQHLNPIATTADGYDTRAASDFVRATAAHATSGHTAE